MKFIQALVESQDCSITTLEDTALFPDGSVFDPSTAIEVSRSEPEGHVVEWLFVTPDRQLVRVRGRETIDGEMVPRDEDTFETHPELLRSAEPAVIEEWRRRIGLRLLAWRITEDEALEWVLLTWLPEPFAAAIRAKLALPPKTLDDLASEDFLTPPWEVHHE